MRVLLFIVSLLSLLSNAFCLYSSSDRSVIQLTPANFQSTVIKSNELWLVEFYAPWCGHCKSLAPEWKKAAEALDGIVKLGAVDMDAHPALGQPYDVKGFPTIKFFAVNKKKPLDYSGARTAQAIADFALQQAQKVVSARLGGKSGSSSSSSSSSGSKGSKGGASKVVQLTSSNFDELVLQSDDTWMVEFFAPWCGHCKSLAPHWEKAASDLSGTIKLGAVDATVHQDLASKYGIRGYPTIKVFKSGEKDKVTDYEGGRTADAIIQYGRSIGEAPIVAKPVVQLTNKDIFSEYCDPNLCFIAFLPHIYESSASQRNNYISALTKVSDKAAKKGFSFLWTEAGAQPSFEEKLGINSNFYPGFLAVNIKKNRYVAMTSSFSEANLADFIRGLLNGREKTIPLPANLPSIVNAEKWDGKDAPKDESAASPHVDLSDLNNDDD